MALFVCGCACLFRCWGVVFVGVVGGGGVCVCVVGGGVGTDAQDPMNTAEDKGQLKDFDEDCSFRFTSVLFFFLSFLKM